MQTCALEGSRTGIYILGGVLVRGSKPHPCLARFYLDLLLMDQIPHRITNRVSPTAAAQKLFIRGLNDNPAVGDERG